MQVTQQTTTVVAMSFLLIAPVRLPEQKPNPLITPCQAPCCVYALALLTPGKMLAMGELRMRNGSGKHRALAGHHEFVLRILFCPNGKRLASARGFLWNSMKGKKAEHAPKLQPKELQRLWEELASDDAMKAYKAIWALAAAPRQSVPFLQQQLKPVPHVDPKALAHLVKALGNDSFATRDNATRELKKFGALARPTLEKALEAHPPLEVRSRIEGLLNSLTKSPLTRDELRGLRAIETLEYIGNSEAKKLVEKLSKGAPGAPVTEDARETLQRLKKKTESSQALWEYAAHAAIARGSQDL
jgi:hypothetical protein